MPYVASAPRTLCKPTGEHPCGVPNVMSLPQIVRMTLIASLLAMWIHTEIHYMLQFSEYLVASLP